jgi:hypothetical protein
MKQNTIEKFTGLAIQPNSLTVPPGRLERAENAIINQDYIITKCRGENLLAQFPNTQSLNRIWEYGTSLFAISQNTLYRVVTAPVFATIQCYLNSTNVSVRRTSHGLRNNDYISQFSIPTTDAVAEAFEHLTADLYGVRQVQTTFAASVSTSGATTTIDFAEHGMITGNNITISTNARGITPGNYAITKVNENRFTIATASSSTGAVTYEAKDAFRISSTNPANASVLASATNAASYLYYNVVTSPAISVTANGIGVSRQFAAQGNSYFTTDNGIYKLEREDLPALEAGMPPGLDVQVAAVGAAGPIKANSQTAYRIVFGRKDAQGNLVIGAPSQQAILYNSTRIAASMSVTIVGTLATMTVLDSGHPFTQIGEFVTIVQYTPVTTTTPPITIAPNSQFDIKTVSVGASFTFQYPVPAGIPPSPPSYLATIEYSYNPTGRITASVPNEVASTEYLYQVYRTSGSVSATSEPFDDFRLVAEQNLSSTDVSNGFLTYTDDLPDLLLAGQPFLYTNSNQEGILQANARPPRAEDVAVFKGYAFYANTVQYHLRSLTTVDPTLIANGDTLSVTDGTTTETYRFYTDATNAPVGNETVTNSIAVAGTTATVNRTAHGFQNNDYIRILSSVGGIPVGEYQITVTTANQFTFTVASGATGDCTFEGTRTSTGQRIVKVVKTTTPATFTVSQAIYYTASYLIKAFNRNSTSIVYAQYTSEVTQPPGAITLLAKNLDQDAFSLTTNAPSALGRAFEPVIPASGTSVQSEADIGPNRLYISKINEPEAVPLFNIRDVGSRASPILRVAALRDSLIILKGDGIYRLNGDSTSNFVVTALDNTVFVKATDSVSVLNNSVYCLSNQGVVQITDSAVRIVSRIIEPLLTAILGQDLENNTSAVGYESERLYLLSVKRPNTLSAVADITYCYNYLTEAWTSWTGANKVFFNGFLRPSDDKLYFIPTLAQNKIVKERKDQNLIDYTGQEYCAPVIKALIGSVLVTASSDVVQVTTLVAHGLSQGQLVTVSRPSSTLTAAFSGGAVDLIGLRTVSIISDTQFTFTASTNSLAGAVGEIYTAPYISEASLTATVANGVQTVTIVTSEPHGLITGDAVTIEDISAGIAACFTNPSDILGYRSATYIDATTFSVLATNSAIASAVDTLVLTDKKQSNLTVTIDTVGLFQPSAGDAIICENRLYKIESVIKFSTISYIAKLQTPYKAQSNSLSFVNQAYRTLVKFSPLVIGQVGLLKQFSEFQCTFRSFQSCSNISLDFSSDSVTSSTKQQWNYKVGTNGVAPTFGGWGELEWGNFPWGGEASIQRIYTTQPAVILRTYVPREVFIGTFIQPILDHKVAGEPLELQAISLFSKPVTQRVSR